MIALAVVVTAAAMWAITALATGIGLGRVIARADEEEARASLPAALENRAVVNSAPTR